MSAGHQSRRPSHSARSQGSRGSGNELAVQPLHLSDNTPPPFKPCAATASFFLHAQRNVIFCLHHDTLAIERRFERHADEILFISADNVSDRGAGRFVVSYDASQTAIVWDLFTGDEIARFASYETIRVAEWMRDGKIAFGNAQGSVILFDPATSEHVASRTIFDPVTALAPASDCKTFAIGYLNGSILVATLQPFTILHTLNTSRGPSPISGLAWHGSSSKSKTEMLATQTSDGDLRVWSIAKTPATEAPRIIRILGASEMSNSSKSWFAWSKNGRIVQHIDEETRSWDVRTKKVSQVRVPTVSDVVAIANYGPTATLFTIGPDHWIQQYDLNPTGAPAIVANLQHAPVNAPPTPPDSAPRETPPPIDPPTVPLGTETSSEDEGSALSPLQKIAREMEQIEEEMRDRVGPLSPVSSRASSRASMSSSGSYGRRHKVRSRERNHSSRGSEHGSDRTMFTGISSVQTGRESVSVRSMSSAASSHYQSSSLRNQTLRSPEEPRDLRSMDLFPYLRARLSEVKFRTPQFGSSKLTPDVLRREMLSVVFGWEDDIEPLVREEMAHHNAGSASSVLLAKWVGDNGADQLAAMVGSESMTSTDWMLLAMTCQMGQGSQKQVGEAFVRRLLETDEIHPAVAILLGLGQHNDAVEAYVSRKFFMEAVLLTCLLFPNDWQRQSFLLRKWGETAVAQGQAELAVRCFSCTSVDTSEPWFSPRAQGEVEAAQQSMRPAASPTSPQSAGASTRLTSMNASLSKLTTSFDRPAPRAALNTIGVTPIADSAISPGGEKPWKRSTSRGLRDPSSARTATPGGYSRPRRGPSANAEPRTALDADATPLVGGSRPGSRLSNKDPGTAVKSRVSDALPSPAPGIFAQSRGASRTREPSRDRNRNHLQIQMVKSQEGDEEDYDGSHYLGTASTHSRHHKSHGSIASHSRDEFHSPLLTSSTNQSFRGRNIDRYIDSLEEANIEAEQLRAQNRSRTQSRDGRSRSQARRRAESSSRSDVAYIRPSKRSPSSPAAMNTEEAFKFESDRNSYEKADSSDVTSPVDSRSARPRASSRGPSKARASSRSAANRAASKSRTRQASPDRYDEKDDRGRGHSRKISSTGQRSPPSPSPMKYSDDHDDVSESHAARSSRQRSKSRPDRERSSTRARSSSRRPQKFTLEEPWSANPDRTSGEFPADDAKSPVIPRPLSRKELAQKELEERRLSLARRPSVPAIPHPNEFNSRPSLSPRSFTDTTPVLSGSSFTADPIRERSRTADPESTRPKLNMSTNVSRMPSIGLPATPRAMRHPHYMGADPDERDAIPAVPALPESFQQQQQQQQQQQSGGGDGDQLGPLLPSSVYGQKGLPRSASAPPEQLGHLRVGPSSKHTRRPSEKDALQKEASQGNGGDGVVVLDATPLPPVLPELQHLATPPPPPPPPAPPGALTMSLEPSGERTSPPAGTNPLPSASPNASRRGRGSISGLSERDGLSGMWQKVSSRMRADSRNRAKSPPQPPALDSFTPSPYETRLPPLPGGAGWSGPSPKVGPGEAQYPPPLPPPPPPAPAQVGMVIQAGKGNSPTKAGSMAGYRNPKEIRAAVDGGQF